MQHTHRDFKQFIFADLEQFIARKGFQNRKKIFPRVARMRKSGAIHDVRNFLP